jgi:hypothetical protein
MSWWENDFATVKRNKLWPSLSFGGRPSKLVKAGVPGGSPGKSVRRDELKSVLYSESRQAQMDRHAAGRVYFLRKERISSRSGSSGMS